MLYTAGVAPNPNPAAMRESSTVRHAARRYAIEFGSAMSLYVIAVVAVSLWLRGHPDSSARSLVALIPVVPVVLVLVAAVRQFHRMDELVQRRQIEALAFAFVGTALGVITYGFLESAGFPRISLWWVWITMGVLWIVGCGVTARRYR